MDGQSRISFISIDAQLEAKEEGFVPLNEMPIKKLEFTPHKNAMNIAPGANAGQKVAPAAQPSATSNTASKPADVIAPVEPTAASSGGLEPIKVFLRLRPLPSEYTGESSITVIDDTTVALQAAANAALNKEENSAIDRFLDKTDQDKYKFSRVFGPDTRQVMVHEETTAPLVAGLFEGQNGLVFAYGPTNSGKTFTIQGGKEENAGILPRTLEALYGMISERSKRDSCGEDFTVWVTYMEIYNENVYDLLEQAPDRNKGEARKVCKIKEHNGNVHVTGLKEVQARSLEEARQVLRYGAKHRQVAETMSNEVSSRSHSVFNIKLVPNRGADTDPTDPAQVYSKLAIVDLAGSERALKTKAQGERLKEGSLINVSLMNLGRCLEALRWNQVNPGKVAHVVPFRHSKLTRIFQDHFLNFSRICMIIAVNPHPSDFDEALQALRYGAIAKEIVVKKTMDTRKPVPPPSTLKKKRSAESAMKAPEPPAEEWEEVHVEDLVSELEGLRAQVYELQAKNAQLEEVVREEVCEEMMRNIEEMERAFQVRIEDERITTEQKFERKLEIITRELTRRECALSQEEMGEVIAQLNFYKARVDEMQRDHKASLQRLMPAGQARDDATAEQGEGQQQQQQAQFLAAQVAKLQKELEDKNEALDSKRKQQNESRLVLEEADSVIRQLEQRVKCAEEQNDRLREELAQARGAGARLNEERHRSQADWEAKLQEVEARRVRTVGELEGKVERERVEKEEMRLRVDALQGMLERYDEVLTKKQKMDVLKKSSEGGGFTFSLGSWRGGAATVHGDSPARSGSKPTGGFSALKNIFSPKTDVPPPLDKPDSSRQQHSLKRKSSEGEPPSMAPKVPSVAAARPKDAKKGCNSELDNCPVHLLAYMLPDDDSYARGSPLHKRAPLSPAGNSVVNIKANAPAVSGPHKEEVSSTCRAVKTRKLFNLSLEEAEELNNAAGAALVEGTPMQRRLRSSSKANGLMC